MKFKMASWRVKEEGTGGGAASFVNPGCFFSCDMCCLFTSGGVSLKQVGGFLILIKDPELSLLSLYMSPL